MTTTAAVLVDTDVVSFTFKKDTRAAVFRQHLVGRNLIISFMTLAELHNWALQHRWGEARLEKLTRHLARYAIHHSDAPTCELWAEMDYQARRAGRPISCADAWIAASALRLGVPLVTHNPDDDAGISGLTLFTAIEQE